MLTKLLKYDFKSLFKSLLPIYLIAVLVALLTRLFNMAADSISVLQYPSAIISGLTILLIIGIPFATFIFSIVKYYNNMVKDEGYLTHTLPVKKGSLVISKLITATSAIIISLLVSISITFLAFDISSDLLAMIGELIIKANDYDMLLIPIITLTILVSYISNLLLIYASISLGQMHNGNKGVYSVVFGIVLYNASQLVSTVLMFVPAIFIDGYIENFEKEIPPKHLLMDS